MSTLLTMSLLAIAFLTSTAYAGRLDPPLDTKVNQPNLHSASEKVFLVKGKSEDGSVPKNPTAAAAAAVQKAPTEEPTLIPFDECAEKCKGVCVCPLIWPPPKFCSCFATIKSSCPTVIVEKILAKEHEKSSEDDEYSGPIPYTECIKTCKYCACTFMWPPESNWCICGMPKKPVAEKVFLVKGKSEDGSVPKNPTAAAAAAVQKAPTEEPELIPFDQCAEKCKGVCACPLIWPPPKFCSCFDVETMTRDECNKTCKKQCACTLPWPPEREICVCGAPKSQAAGGKALPV